MPRLCILTQYFPPEMGAPQARLSELGERLIDRGWQVEALTALPNYPTGKVFDRYTPGRPCIEQIGRIRTIRVPLFTAQDGFSRRLRSFLSFAKSAARHGARLCERPDLLYVESPPLFIGYAAKKLARRWRCPFVLNVSDLWPESAVRMGIVRPGIATRLAERLELNLYRSAAGVTGQSSGIIESIRRRSVLTRTATITNGVEPQRFGPSKADQTASRLLGPEPGPIFVYAGLFGHAQGLEQIVDVAKQLPDEVPGRFVLVGDGPMRAQLQRRICAESIKRVKILPAQPRERIPSILASCQAAVISLGMNLPGAVPSKIYEAMASSLPILLIADGEAAQRVTNAQCGLTVRCGDNAAVLAAVIRLATSETLRNQLGNSGRRAAVEVYDRNRIAEQLDAFLKSTLGQLNQSHRDVSSSLIPTHLHEASGIL